MDNSVYARLNESVGLLRDHPKSVPLRRLLRLMTAQKLRRKLRLQFMVSQALYYDRVRDKNEVEGPLRLIIPALLESKQPKEKGFIKEWPVARVGSKLAQMPQPESITAEGEQTFPVEVRMTTFRQYVDQSDPIRDFFKQPYVDVRIAICVYSPGVDEDLAATAFGFTNFAAVRDSRIADVCHVASHRRFATKGDLFVALDNHFDKTRLASIGVTLLDPADLLKAIDPAGLAVPIKIR